MSAPWNDLLPVRVEVGGAEYGIESEYDSFYEVISSPEDSHSVSFPYGSSVLAFDAYVANGEDELWDILNGRNRWNNLTVNFIAMTPQRSRV